MRTNVQSERGSILIIVLWIAFGLVSLAIYFGQSMTFELRAANNRMAAMEADQAIHGALRYAIHTLASQTNGQPPDLASYQREAVTVDETVDAGGSSFWFIGRSTNDTTTINQEKLTFALVDESAKLNLNSLTTNFALYNLPNMTDELMAAIIDWKSRSTTASEGGAKDETYSRLTPAYYCKNGPYETVEELNMVYGMTKRLLYGEDANQNGILDVNENDGDLTEPTDNRDSKLDPGLLEYFTVYTYEPTNRVDGSARININSSNEITQVQTILQERVSAVASQAYTAIRNRIQPQSTGRNPQTGQPNPPPPATPFTSMIDLYVTVSGAGMTADDFALIAQDLYIPPSATGPIVGQVNINTASEAVLSCIPGIDVTNAATVVSYRQQNSSALTSVAWLVDAIGATAARTAGRYVTAYTYQFSADIAAIGRNGHGYRRTRYVIDIADSMTGLSTPRVVYRQDLTHLGWALGKETRQNIALAKNNLQ